MSLKNEIIWMFLVTSFVTGLSIGVATEHYLLTKPNQPVAVSAPISCEWRAQPVDDSNQQVINCFSTGDGSYMGHVKEEPYGWDAYYPKKDEAGALKNYATFKDVQSAENYVNKKLGEL